MPPNVQPIFTLTPNVGKTQLLVTQAIIGSTGVSAGGAATTMQKVWTTGANGSYLDRIRCQLIASVAATNSAATTVRAFLSTISVPGATIAGTDTWLLGEIALPIVAAAHSTNAANFYDMLIQQSYPTGLYVHVAQHIAQNANQQIQCTAFGGDY